MTRSPTTQLNMVHIQMTISPQPAHNQFESYQWTTESRSSQQRHGTMTPSQDGRLSAIPDPVERHVARWRSESRNSNKDKVFRNDEEFSQQDEIVNGTLTALKNDVEQTTEIIRRKQEQMRMERRQFQTEMEVNGRITIDPTDDWLAARLKAVSADDMNQQLNQLKQNQKSRIPSPESRVPSPESRVPSPESRVPSPESRVPSPESRVPSPESRVPSPESRVPSPESRVPSPESRVPSPESRVPSPESRVPSPESRVPSPESRIPNPECGISNPVSGQNAVTDTLAALVYDVNATTEVLRRGQRGRDGENGSKKKKEEIEYTLRLTPAPEEQIPQRPKIPEDDQLEKDDYSREYGVQMTEETDSLRRRRARSTTPRRTLHISGSPPPPPPAVCAYCSEEIDGAILTALAPNSERAQKFHTYHFMCTYCQKALNMHGTFREHDRKPYCHDCFYKLYNGLQYAPDDHQASIEKLI
ncbi:hypothetical protein B9Z55_003930 [Caenorhabditis nigoni]|uniref:LIM zinc-binding domain-containing protein n=1 Tax=Caenorhabditis nigoni TaxID=1611254 RepID=A0A2G5VTH5_9PELO|nr:hypothetical protein B9Z55_003930 [Caenorhabditis nigoni]